MLKAKAGGGGRGVRKATAPAVSALVPVGERLGVPTEVVGFLFPAAQAGAQLREGRLGRRGGGEAE